jgi:hypothetical protein
LGAAGWDAGEVSDLSLDLRSEEERRGERWRNKIVRIKIRKRGETKGK